MQFSPAKQNGITPPTQLYTRPSNSRLLVSSTSSAYGQTVVLKFLNDAAYYKRSSVTFYSKYYNGVSTSTITLGTSTFVNTVTAPLVVNNLGTGTHGIYAVWPGEDRFAGVDTSSVPLNVTIAPGVALGGNFTATISPPSGTVVTGEGEITIDGFFNTSTIVPNNVIFLIDHQQIGSAPVLSNEFVFKINGSYETAFPAGTHDITISWPGATINSTNYSGEHLDVNYQVLAGTTLGYPISLEISPSHGVYQEGVITLTANISTSTNLLGNFQFYQNGSPVLGPQALIGNSATIHLTNNLSVGTSTFYAIWDGNQAGHPRYIPITSDTISWNNLARETIGSLDFTVTPNPSAHIAITEFVATATTATSVPGSVIFFVDGAPFGTAPLINNTAIYNTGTLTIGDHTVYAYYPGNATAPKFFPLASSTQTLTVLPGYILEVPITLTYSTPDVINEPITLVASATTTTNLTNNVIFYANGTQLGLPVQWINNTATTVVTIPNTGTYDLQAYWVGGTLTSGDEEGNYYQGKYSNTATVTVLAAQTLQDTTFTLVTNNNLLANNSSTTLVATLNTTTQFNGTTGGIISFLDISTATARVIGTSTFINNTATLTINTSTLAVGTYTLQAVWAGSPVTPKYFGFTSNSITQSIYQLITLTDAQMTIYAPSPDGSLWRSQFHYYNVSSTATNNTVIGRFIFGGYNASHPPTGSVTFRDSLGNTLGTTDLFDSTSTYIPITPVSVQNVNQYQGIFNSTAIPLLTGKYLEFSTTSSAITNIIPEDQLEWDSYLPEYVDNLILYANGVPYTQADQFPWKFALLHWWENGATRYILNPIWGGNNYSINVNTQPSGIDTITPVWTSLSTMTLELKVVNPYPTMSIQWNPITENQLDKGNLTVSATYSGDHWNAPVTVTIPYANVVGDPSFYFNPTTKAQPMPIQVNSTTTGPYTYVTADLLGVKTTATILLYDFGNNPNYSGSGALVSSATATSTGTVTFPPLVSLTAGNHYMRVVSPATSTQFGSNGEILIIK